MYAYLLYINISYKKYFNIYFSYLNNILYNIYL